MVMPSIPFRRLLSRLTALALSTSSVAMAAAPPDVTPSAQTASDNDGDDDDDADLDPDLTIVDNPCVDRADAALALGRSLAQALHAMRPLSATHLVATWALADDTMRRLAVAHALEWTFPVIGDGVAIDHLAHDADPAIRIAAARAAWARRTRGGDMGVLARLVDDPDPDVRAVAMSARPLP